ncbi:hypothetical protein [Catenovulum maritimum]|uniref:Uncharacterized protein n=1 Tax=Catenovulum maritimum TaxID=1513271 RepID=A0A0J8GP28_9ALTE|nr:hypothetical protein [Catenovulum maritimum]KMT64517.1 hypothetical protein XM47_13735 [Catenovulum maritimum]
MNEQEQNLKKLLENGAPPEPKQPSLNNVIKRAQHINNVKDIGGLFVSWFWVLLLGLGSNAYTHYHKINRNKQSKPIHKKELTK